MSLLQSYIFRQVLGPLLVTLAALTALAILTQSLSTLDLVVQNRQSAGTFFKITLLALPQLVSLILPLAVFIAMLYGLNRLNGDSEMVVARASGVGPWQIASPCLRLAALAALTHLVVNLVVQPASFREMRSALLSVRTDLASQMVQPGMFARPAPDLTLYGRDIDASGLIEDLIIEDSRQLGAPTTYVAKTGRLQRGPDSARLTLFNGTIQQVVDIGSLDVVEFESHQIDLSDVAALDTNLRLKSSDLYLHELRNPARTLTEPKRTREHLAEANARLATPLYGPMLALLALVFLVKGQHQRMGYGRRIALCAGIGFGLRMIGFGLEAAAALSPVFNPVQYAFPLLVSGAALIYLVFGNSRSPAMTA